MTAPPAIAAGKWGGSLQTGIPHNPGSSRLKDVVSFQQSRAGSPPSREASGETGRRLSRVVGIAGLR